MLNFNWLNSVSVGWAKFFVLMAFIAPLVFALSLKKSYIYHGAADHAWWRNLKLWVLFIVGVQLVIYLYF